MVAAVLLRERLTDSCSLVFVLQVVPGSLMAAYLVISDVSNLIHLSFFDSSNLILSPLCSVFFSERERLFSVFELLISVILYTSFFFLLYYIQVWGGQ